MDTGELLDITAELVDALAEATGHDVCDHPGCVICGEVTGRDVFSLLHALERALGSYLVEPEARGSPAGAEVNKLLHRFQEVSQFRPAPWNAGPGLLALPEFDGKSAQRLFVYLKAVAMNVHHGLGWPRIET